MIALGVWVSSIVSWYRCKNKKCTPLAFENRKFNPISSSPKKQNRHLSVANESFFSDSPPQKSQDLTSEEYISPTSFHANHPMQKKKIHPWESVHREVSRSVEGRNGPPKIASDSFPSDPPINLKLSWGDAKAGEKHPNVNIQKMWSFTVESCTSNTVFSSGRFRKQKSHRLWWLRLVNGF